LSNNIPKTESFHMEEELDQKISLIVKKHYKDKQIIENLLKILRLNALENLCHWKNMTDDARETILSNTVPNPIPMPFATILNREIQVINTKYSKIKTEKPDNTPEVKINSNVSTMVTRQKKNSSLVKKEPVTPEIQLFKPETSTSHDFKDGDEVYVISSNVLYGASILKFNENSTHAFVHYYGFNASTNDAWVEVSRLKPVIDVPQFSLEKKSKQPIVRDLSCSPIPKKRPIENVSFNVKVEEIERKISRKSYSKVPPKVSIHYFDNHLFINNKNFEFMVVDLETNKRYKMNSKFDVKFISILNNGLFLTINSSGVLQSSKFVKESKIFTSITKLSISIYYIDTKFMLSFGNNLYTLEFEAVYKIFLQGKSTDYVTISEITKDWDTVIVACLMNDEFIFAINAQGDLFKIPLFNDSIDSFAKNKLVTKETFKYFIQMKFFDKTLFGLDSKGNLYILDEQTGEPTLKYSNLTDSVDFTMNNGTIWFIDEYENVKKSELN
jgi:hypothetical protein